MSGAGRCLAGAALAAWTLAPATIARAGAGGPQAETKETPMGRDEAYRRLFVILDSARAALEQQPTNRAAQARYLEELDGVLRRLPHTRPERPPAEPTEARDRGGRIGEGEAAAPGGPVRPSDEPSRDEDAQRRTDATHKFLKGGPGGPPHADKSLRGVPEEWLTRASERAEELARALRDDLSRGEAPPRSIESSLEDLRSAVEAIGRPRDGGA